MRRVEEWIEGEMERLTPPEAIANAPALKDRAPRAASDRRAAPLTPALSPKSGERERTVPSVPSQLELPFLAEAGRSDLRGPTQPPPGRLRHVQLSTRVVPYWLRRARRRTIGIVVDERGVSAAAPRWATIAEVEGFIREKERWVMKRLDEVRREARAPFLWQEGARLPYLGRDVSLARTVWAGVRLAGQRLEVPALAFESATRLRETVHRVGAALGARRSTASASPRSGSGSACRHPRSRCRTRPRSGAAAPRRSTVAAGCCCTGSSCTSSRASSTTSSRTSSRTCGTWTTRPRSGESSSRCSPTTNGRGASCASAVT